MTDLRIGVVGVPGGWSTERLADALEARTGFRAVLRLEDACADLARRSVLAGDLDLCSLDGLVVKKISSEYSPAMLDRIELLRFIASMGVPVFSKPESLLRVVDRLSCTVTLRASNVPMPETIVSESLEAAQRKLEAFGSAVLKPLYSTKARGMTVVSTHDPRELSQRLAAFRDAGNPMIYAQKKIAIPGRDLGLAFVGGQYLTAYARVAHESAWNTTTHAGGRYERHEPSASLIALAHRAQALFDLDFTTVDMVETDDGPMVFEVSAFGGFRGIHDSSGIDAASVLADHVIAKVRHG